MRRKWLAILGYTVAGVLGLAVAAAAYLALSKPAMANPPAIRIASTPERIARGKHIFILADCDGCHSERDWTRFGGPVLTRGKGTVFPSEMGLPGTVSAPNITPDRATGIGAWTDGEKIRAIRDGVGRDGRALFPMMPYEHFRKMSDEDVYSLVAYLNTLPPVKNRVPRTQLNFPVNMLIKSAPRPAGYVSEPDRANRWKYGEYLVHVAGCMECHTQRKGPHFGGGAEFNFGPQARVVSANISPDPQTGIGRWSEDYFLERIYQYKEYVENGSPKVTADSFTVMPWLNLAQLPAEDLRAIYTFLRSRKPVYNAVETHPALLQADSRQRR